MKRQFRLRFMILFVAAALVLPIAAKRSQQDHADAFQLVEATIQDIQDAFDSHLLAPSQIVSMYLARIEAYDKAGPHLNSYMVVNPEALEAAHELEENDDQQGQHRDRPLFGIPMIVKDNNDTFDMPTTAGSVALGGSVPPDDAFLVKKLRRAGAIILGKGTLTEYANFLTNGMPAGYSSQLRFQLGGTAANSMLGYGFNPYDPRPDPRTGFNDGRPALSPGGSSSGPGIAVSANLATVGIGTETSGSILSPGTMNLLVGIKPTRGLVSRDGIVPITADQDTAGPLARTVTDAAKVLGVIAGFDPQDSATAPCLKPGNCFSDYTQFLRKQALKGAHIAVPYFSYWTNGGGTPNLTPTQLQVMTDAMNVMRAAGADVEFYDIPDQAELNSFPGCGNLPQTNCSTVLLYGFKRDLNAYLASLGPNAPVKTLEDVINYNSAHSAYALKYGQILALAAETLDTSPGSADTVRYNSDRAKDLDIAKTRGLDVVFSAGFDAILFPANRGANIAARAGYPSIVVPGGFVTNQPELNIPPGTPFPAGFNPNNGPYGVTFSGPAFSEPRLIALAYAFEQATKHRVSPSSTPPLASDVVRRSHSD
ncbi:MAG TPA: amidase family protein [Candidatus Acidoferrum sp.]|nr:amidase family protein [Candidatus Acidoferrum sp.]